MPVSIPSSINVARPLWTVVNSTSTASDTSPSASTTPAVGPALDVFESAQPTEVADAPLADRAKIYFEHVKRYAANPSASPLPQEELTKRFAEYLAVASPFLYGAEGDEVPYEDQIPGTSDLYQAYGISAAEMSALRANRLLPLFDANAEKFVKGGSRPILTVQMNDEPYLHLLRQDLHTGIITHVQSRNVMDLAEEVENIFPGFEGDGFELMSRIFAKKKDATWFKPEQLGLSPAEHGNNPRWWE